MINYSIKQTNSSVIQEENLLKQNYFYCISYNIQYWLFYNQSINIDIALTNFIILITFFIA